jgi:hypothetical protein
MKGAGIAAARVGGVAASLVVVVIFCMYLLDEIARTHERSRCDTMKGVLELIIGSLMLSTRSMAERLAVEPSAARSSRPK